MPVGQHDDLAIVAHLEELFGAPVHIADDGFGGDDPLPVEDQLQPQHTVGGRVLRTDVEHHVSRFELICADAYAYGRLLRHNKRVCQAADATWLPLPAGGSESLG